MERDTGDAMKTTAKIISRTTLRKEKTTFNNYYETFNYMSFTFICVLHRKTPTLLFYD